MREPEWARAWSRLPVIRRVLLALGVGAAAGAVAGALSIVLDVPWLLALYPVLALVFGVTTAVLVRRRRRRR